MIYSLTKKQAEKIAAISADANTSWSDYSLSSIEPSFLKKTKQAK